jgi:hypothetical protein
MKSLYYLYAPDSYFVAYLVGNRSIIWLYSMLRVSLDRYPKEEECTGKKILIMRKC